MTRTSDLRIRSISPLVPPGVLKKELPETQTTIETVVRSRQVIEDILLGRDRRVLAIVGPCSIHDPVAALEFASRLNVVRRSIEDRIFPVMRVYFEKPRTSIGWPGFVFDPALDGSGDINRGLREARRLLLDITGMGLAAGSEMLDPIVPQYIADLISWASIGARTTESQTHRMMASGLSMPVGFKNGTDGSLEPAINAMTASTHPHSFIGIDQEGRTVVLKTTGNSMVHLILRGGRLGPNYYEENVEKAQTMLEKAGTPLAIVMDCSHANSGRRYSCQERVFQAFLSQRRRGRESLKGFMLESNLVPGSQSFSGDPSALVYGLSITDECMGWEETEALLRTAWDSLAEDA